MKLDDVFPSQYMKASDLPEQGAVTLTIEKVTVEEIGKEKQQKPVIHFLDHDKSFVCNKTNWNTIVRVLGSDDSDDWAKKSISLGRSEVEAFGEMVEAIRVRLRTAPARSGKLDNDDVPF